MTAPTDRAPWTVRARTAAVACARDVSRLAPGVGAALGMGAVACVACCALPLALGAAGLGSAALVGGAMATFVEPWIGAATVALVLVAVGVHFARRRAEPKADTLDGMSCSTDGACGCGPRSKPTLYESPRSGPNEPIVCTAGIDKPSADEQLRAYRAVFDHLASRERFDGGFRWRFRGGEALEAQLRELAEREHACCRFFAFHLVRDGSDIVWETRADERAAGVLEEYFGLPERLSAPATAEPTALTNVYRSAGLSFAADGAARDRG